LSNPDPENELGERENGPELIRLGTIGLTVVVLIAAALIAVVAYASSRAPAFVQL
jgi:hypothetical protein